MHPLAGLADRTVSGAWAVPHRHHRLEIIMSAYRNLAIGAFATVAIVGCGAAAKSTPSTGSVPSSVPGSQANASTTIGSAVNPNAPEVKQIGDIPDNSKYVPYSPTTGLYSVTYPEGWSRTGDGEKVSFTDKFNAIEVSVVAKVAAPTVASVTTDDMKVLSTKTGHFTLGKVSAVTRTGGNAILATYEIDSAPNAVTGKSIRVAVERYEFWKNGKSAVVTLIGAVGADNVDPWRRVSDSFGWTK